jgi:hypothetical protein
VSGFGFAIARGLHRRQAVGHAFGWAMPFPCRAALAELSQLLNVSSRLAVPVRPALGPACLPETDNCALPTDLHEVVKVRLARASA